jgi:hypothetical protein
LPKSLTFTSAREIDVVAATSTTLRTTDADRHTLPAKSMMQLPYVLAIGIYRPQEKCHRWRFADRAIIPARATVFHCPTPVAGSSWRATQGHFDFASGVI